MVSLCKQICFMQQGYKCLQIVFSTGLSSYLLDEVFCLKIYLV